MNMHLELVEWDDAWENTETISITPRNITKIAKGMKTQTVGFIVSDTAAGVLMVSEIWPSDTKHAKYITFIPTGMIVSRTKLIPDV